MVRASLMLRWVVGSIVHGGPIELFLVPANARSDNIQRCKENFVTEKIYPHSQQHVDYEITVSSNS